MRPALLALTAALTLSACIEADMNLEVLSAEEGRVTGYIQMNRAMFDMSGGDVSFCDTERGGTIVMTDTHARCNIDQTGPFAELFSTEEDAGPADMQARVEALDGNRVRAIFPLDGMNDGMEEMQDDPAMQAMVRQMLAGFNISFSVSGVAVEETTGTLSEDGTRATFSITLDDLFAPADDRPGEFTSVVRY